MAVGCCLLPLSPFTSLCVLSISSRSYCYFCRMTEPRRRQVLSEEDYTAQLTDVIQRDYFPHNHLTAAANPHNTQQHASLTELHHSITSQDNADYQVMQAKEVQEAEAKRNHYLMLTQSDDGSTTRKQPSSQLLLASDAFNATPHRPRILPASTENTFFFAAPPAQLSSAMPPPRERRIEPSATRFPVVVSSLPDHNDDESTLFSDASTDLDASSFEESPRQTTHSNNKPRRLVNLTPRVAPNASPLTTWGTLAAKPIVLKKKISVRSKSSLGTALRASYQRRPSRSSSLKSKDHAHRATPRIHDDDDKEVR